MKHTGEIISTGKRVYVVFMQIPQREDHALVIDVDSLSDMYLQVISEIVESPEAQAIDNLADVLGRRLMPDTGKPALQTLHERRMLIPMINSNINMVPFPNQKIKLNELLVKMGRQTGSFYEEQNIAQTSEEKIATANNILAQADLMMNEVATLRERAYNMAPELRPV